MSRMLKLAKKSLGLMTIAILSTSCISSLDGQLHVLKPMLVKKQGGFLGLKKKKITLSPEIYKSELAINGEQNLTLKLKLNENEVNIPLNSDSTINIPANGEIKVSHLETKQPFDIVGVIKTDIEESSSSRDIESCSITVMERHCDKVCVRPPSAPDHRDRDPVPRCEIVCRNEPTTIYGRQEVEYHFEITHRNVSLNFINMKTRELLANFQGKNSELRTVYDYKGQCK